MVRKAALKLSFAPDDYLVTWQLPSVTGGTVNVNGLLTVEAGKPPQGTAHGDFDKHLEKTGSGTHFPQSVDASIVTGSLSNGANVLLVNARVRYWFLSQAHIDAEAAIITLADVSNTVEASFKGFEIQMGGLDAIAGVGPIKNTTIPIKGAAGTWAAEIASDFKQEWTDHAASMCLTYFGSIHSLDPYAFSMGFSPVLSCELAKTVSLHQLLDDWIDPLRRVVSIGTGRPEEITYLTVYLATGPERENKGQLFGSGITQEPYESSREEITRIKAPINLKSDKVSLLNLIRTWQKLASVHHPLLETYGAMLHAPDQHPRSRFLLLLQAIEGAHAYATKESFAKRQKAHTEKREKILALAEGCLEGSQFNFLERALSKRPPGGLEQAINWLVDKFPGSMKAQLDATSLITAAKATPRNAKNAPDALRIIRNDLAHGTKGYDAYELHQVVTVLEKMVRVYALEIFGCPSHVITRALDTS